jgi:hypothetical protein
VRLQRELRHGSCFCVSATHARCSKPRLSVSGGG